MNMYKKPGLEQVHRLGWSCGKGRARAKSNWQIPEAFVLRLRYDRA